jgi:hypothetical protein
MPAELVPPATIQSLADTVLGSPALLRVLRELQQAGFIQNSEEDDPETTQILTRLSELGLVDPGHHKPGCESEPFIWVRNGNGGRVLKHIDVALADKLQFNRHVQTALEALPERDRQTIRATVESIAYKQPSAWPPELVSRVSPSEPMYFVRVHPDYRAVITVSDTGRIELVDMMREDTLRQFLERSRDGRRVG